MTLTTNDAKIVIGMVNRGDKHHDIAAWFGENQGRVADILEGKFGTSEAAPVDQLPPKGAPGIKGRRLRAFAEKALSALRDGRMEEAINHLEAGIERYDRHE